MEKGTNHGWRAQQVDGVLVTSVVVAVPDCAAGGDARHSTGDFKQYQPV